MKKTREGHEWMFARSCVIASRPTSPQGCHQYPRKLIRQQPPPTFAIWGLALFTLPCTHVCSSNSNSYFWKWLIRCSFPVNIKKVRNSVNRFWATLAWLNLELKCKCTWDLQMFSRSCRGMSHWGPKAVDVNLEHLSNLSDTKHWCIKHQISKLKPFPLSNPDQTCNLFSDTVWLSALCVFSHCCDRHKVPLARRYDQEAFGPTPESQDSSLCTQGAACNKSIDVTGRRLTRAAFNVSP